MLVQFPQDYFDYSSTLLIPIKSILYLRRSSDSLNEILRHDSFTHVVICVTELWLSGVLPVVGPTGLGFRTSRFLPHLSTPPKLYYLDEIVFMELVLPIA